MGMLLSGDTPPLMNTSWPEFVCFSTKITVRFFSPGCGGDCVVVSSPPSVVDVVGPGEGPGPVPSHPTQMAKIPSNLRLYNTCFMNIIQGVHTKRYTLYFVTWVVDLDGGGSVCTHHDPGPVNDVGVLSPRQPSLHCPTHLSLGHGEIPLTSSKQ